MKTPYSDQARLLVNLLPIVEKQPCFALKGGTAINLFIKDMPRLSVDIDLAYLPVQDRDESLDGIDAALGNIISDIEKQIPRVRVIAMKLKSTDKRHKLLVQQDSSLVISWDITGPWQNFWHPNTRISRRFTEQNLRA